MTFKANNKEAFLYARERSKIILPFCQPLFNAFGLTTFGYKRVYLDGRYVFFSTNEPWLSDHYEKVKEHGTFFSDAMKKAVQNGFHNTVWPHESDDFFIQMLHQHNMWNGINFYKGNDSYIELWTFSTEKDRFLDLSVYLNILEYLKHFIVFFNANFLNNILRKDQLKFGNFDLCEVFANTENNSKGSLSQNELECFLDATSLSNIPITLDDHSNIYLSPQETKSLHYFSQSYSAKETAQKMRISPRTVENYINNIKIKTNTHTKREIIDIYKKTYLFEQQLENKFL